MGWFSDNLVTEDQLEQARAKIAGLFRDRGYLDVTVSGPERIPEDDDGVFIGYTVVEGVKYTVASVKITGLTRYPEETVAAKSELPEPGSVAGLKALDDAAHRVKVAVGSGDSGLADTRVDVKRVPSADDPSKLNVVFAVTEGVPVVINEVKIRGNDYTKDKVIRREIALGPGDRMLEDRAERSQKRLENLNYFSRVRYYLETRDGAKNADGAEYRDLVYEVEEKNTGSFMVGIGASSIDSVYLSAEVSQANFDLFAPSKLFRGAGQKGRLYAAWGPRYQSLEASVTEPYFLDRMLELTGEGYRRLRWYDEYDLIRSGGAASLSYPVKFWPTWSPFGRLGFRLSGEFIEFDDVDDGTYWYDGRQVSFRGEESKYGDAFEPALRVFWMKDSRDNYRAPRSGHRTQVFGDIVPGGDNEYWRLGVSHRSYFTTWKKFDHVLMVGLRAETIDGFGDDVPIYNRMFLGGPKSIRGIEYRHVSPFATRDQNGSGEAVPWGGQTLFCMNFEYTVPIFKMLRVAAFSDLGSVGPDEFDCDMSDTFAWTVGVGLRIDIPMFPIRLDFATPIEEPDHADKEAFSFTVGYDF
jgi:outer membrane protein insertion porin family